MFKVGDKVRIKKAGPHLDIFYPTKMEGQVVEVDFSGRIYNEPCVRVLFKEETFFFFDDGDIIDSAGTSNRWWVNINNLVSADSKKPRRKKKEPIPEGWE